MTSQNKTSNVLFQGYQGNIPWCCFMIHSESYSRDEMVKKVRIHFTEYITARRKAGVETLCIGDFITYLRKEKGMIVDQDFNITPERLDL